MKSPIKYGKPSPVRLSPGELQAILEVMAAELAGFGMVKAWLFGSRTNMQAKGGDIDLFVETDAPVQDELALARRLNVALLKRLGERQIDIIIKGPNTPDAAIHQIAREKGVLLWRSPVP